MFRVFFCAETIIVSLGAWEKSPALRRRLPFDLLCRKG